MNILILGDIMGASGRKALSNKLPNLIKINKIDFVIVNGENASDDGRGITQKITEKATRYTRQRIVLRIWRQAEMLILKKPVRG